MKIAVLALALVPALYSSTQYSYTSPNYSTIQNYTTCGAGTCANFTDSMSTTMTFTVATPLAPNLSSQEILSQVVSFTASDGLTTFSSTDPNLRVYDFAVSTDADGHITEFSMVLELWRTGTSPHSAGDRLDLVEVFTPTNVVYYNLPCGVVGTVPAGVADACAAAPADSATSDAIAVPGTWTQLAASVPTLGEWGKFSLAGLLLLLGCWQLIRRSSVFSRQ